MDEQRAAEGVDHLQAAALEMIEAARAFLDVAEKVVSDRDRVSEAFGVFTDVARAAARATSERPGGASTGSDAGGDGASESHVQRITLSS
jgi:hypothetical protein